MLRNTVRNFAVQVKTTANKTVSCPNQLLINGQWVNSVSGKTFGTCDPSTGEEICQVAAADAHDVDLAVKAARSALDGAWSEVTPAQRADLLNKFADAVLAHGEELAQLESTDNGKNSAGAQMDVGFMVELLRFNAGAALNLGGQAMQRKDGFGFIRKEPVVAGCITPWNFPMLMTIFKMAPMLAAGSTGVFKTTELTPLSSLKLAEIWTNLPGSVPGVVNMVPGDGMIAGEAIVDHKDVNSIHFTGSTVIGQRIMTRSAQTLKRVHLELGGKSPFIVFDDANIGKAATIAAVFSTLNTGQFCASPTRFFVHEKVHDQFVEIMTSVIKSQKWGRWDEPGVWGGPVISQKQLDKVLGYVKSGVDSGATLVTGGKRIDRPGFFIEPSVFINCKDDMKHVKEEIFGPVASILKFSDTEEVIQRANNSQYGLYGAVFSESMKTCNHVSKKLQVGSVSVNNYFLVGADTPFGGYKQSGIGRELGTHAVDAFLENKTIMWDCS